MIKQKNNEINKIFSIKDITKMKHNKAMAMAQVVVLIFAILAFAFIVGSSIQTVSAIGPGDTDESLCVKAGGECTEQTTYLNDGDVCIQASGANGTTKTGLCPGNGLTICCIPDGTSTTKDDEVKTQTDNRPDCEANNGKCGNSTTQLCNNPTGSSSDWNSDYKCEDENQWCCFNKIEPMPSVTDNGKEYTKDEAMKICLKSGKLTEAICDEVMAKVINSKTEKVDKDLLNKGLSASEKVNKGDQPGTLGTIGSSIKALFTYTSPVLDGGATFGTWAVAALHGIIAAGIGVATVYFIAKAAGAGERNLRRILSGGTGVAIGVTTLVTLGIASFGLGIFIAVVVTTEWMVLTYQDYSKEIFTYSAQPWKAPFGGDNCEKCNDYEFGCSEYQCRSIGAGCELINKGTDHESCAWTHKDSNPPKIFPLESSLDEGYVYVNQTSITPPDRGVYIKYTNDSKRCVPAFTSITLGVGTSELAECKIDTDRKIKYEDMLDYMGIDGSLFLTEHELTIPSSALASKESLNNLGFSFDEGHSYDFFVKCKDSNGQESTGSFAFKFCVQNGPDLTEPKIIKTNYLSTSETTSKAYISYINLNAPLKVYTNEPADCKWDHQDLGYDQMANSMKGCSQNLSAYFEFPYYGCYDTITGINPNEEKDYYIKCKDKPWWQPGDKGKRVENTQPHILTLVGTNPLIIDEVTVEGKENGSTIYGSSNNIKVDLEVKTSAGADEGKAKCQYSLDNKTFYNFYNDGNTDYLILNQQELWLNGNSYSYNIKCSDIAGNMAYETIDFNVVQDLLAPEIVRLYYEDNNLKLVTNEEAECVYSLFGCNYAYEDGTLISTSDNYNHYVDWNTEEDLYIKCRDNFGNTPIPQSQCSVVARAYE